MTSKKIPSTLDEIADAIDRLMMCSHEVGVAVTEVNRSKNPSKKLWEYLENANKAEAKAAKEVMQYLVGLQLLAKGRR